MFATVPTVPLTGSMSPVGIASTSSSTALTLGPTTLRVHGAELNVLEGHGVRIEGKLLAAGGGLGDRVVDLQSLTSRRWSTITRTRTGPHGRFILRYLPRSLEGELMRVRFAGDALDAPARHRLGQMQVYRLAGASWYGGGGTMACGGTLTSSTLGVANKTLPCGTMVTLRYGARSVRVPVVDRGPYVEGREYDLTEATKAALGFGDTGLVWSSR